MTSEEEKKKFKEEIQRLLQKDRSRIKYWVKPTAGHKRVTFYIREKLLIDFKIKCGSECKTATEAINAAIANWVYEDL